LLERAVVSASFNSWERQSAVPCQAGTREAILDRIYRWVDSRDDSTVFWLHGFAGSGKTSIATSVAAKFVEENRLAGSFFFSRDPAHHPGRRSANGVIATIAYQNAISNSAVRNRVEKILDRNRAIFSASPISQLQQLVIDPVRPRYLRYIIVIVNTIKKLFEFHAALIAWASSQRIHLLALVINLFRSSSLNLSLYNCVQALREFCVAAFNCLIICPFVTDISGMALFMVFAILIFRHPNFQHIIKASLEALLNPPPMIVVIDGLDECMAEGLDSIEGLIKLLINEYRNSPPPIRFLLTSWPEDNLRETFLCHPDRTCFTNLMDFKADSDIQRFFRKEFQNLNVRLSDYLTDVVKPWPPSEDIERLVGKSEGLFIYASTLIMFVGDLDDNSEGCIKSPARKLKDAMEQHDGLDDLYMQVLRNAPHSANPDFKRILGVLCLMPSEYSLTLHELTMFLRFSDSAQLRQLLRGCKSILRIPDTSDGTITFFHASLHDFLTNRRRSQRFPDDFFVDHIKQHLCLLENCIEVIIADCKGDRPFKDIVFFTSTPSRYSWQFWHFHLFHAIHFIYKDRHPCSSVIEPLKLHFGDAYERVFSCVLGHLGDESCHWSWSWGWIFVKPFSRNPEGLETEIMTLEYLLAVSVPCCSSVNSTLNIQLGGLSSSNARHSSTLNRSICHRKFELEI